MKTYWGDLHNHCAVSYGQGTPAQALARARQHLDFCTITGHAFWPDMPMDLVTQNTIVGMHLGGFAKLQRFWRSLLAELKATNEPGRFVTLPSYEWHSMAFGDYNCYAPHYDLELIDGHDLKTLTRRVAARSKEFFLLPHHCAYVPGFRGTNWKAFDGQRSPLVEIYSNHGCGEADDAPYDYYHSMGPRTSESMIRQALASGHCFGFYASTDSHDGYPGHYGHGKVGVMTSRLELPSLWAAMRARRTIATTGARIVASLDAGDGGIGDVVAAGKKRDLSLTLEGTAPIDSIELVEGGKGAWRVRKLPVPAIESRFEAGRFKIKIEAGWGRGTALSHWKVKGKLRDGTLHGIEPCFRFSAASSAAAPTETISRTARDFNWTATAIPNPAGAMGGTHFNAGGTQAIVLDITGSARTRLVLEADGLRFDLSLKELSQGSHARQVSGFGSAALKVHRAVPEREFAWSTQVKDYKPFTREGGFAYMRIRQADGHAAWLSPVWFE